MILFFGDVHGSFKHVLPVVQKYKPAAIILLGDMEAPESLEKLLTDVMKLTEVYWIPGNHDTGSKAVYDNLFDSALADRNLHGRVVEIDGFKVAGLGGIFRGEVWFPKHDTDVEPVFQNYTDCVNKLMDTDRWQEYRRMEKAGNKPDGLPSPRLIGKALTHKSSIFYDDYINLYGQQADILVSHEAPSCHPHGFVGIDALAQSMKVGRTFHGHHHDRLDYSSHNERLGFRANGVGFRGVTDLNGQVIEQGKYDNERMYRNEKV
ncbi:MAG: metallophosphoesterase [Candidatus Saccharibacteria bacterium]|nr:metallophosphoesterase [Moraxellaceae bacterium]